MARRTNIANLARLNALMDEQGLDALVLRSGQNFAYGNTEQVPRCVVEVRDAKGRG